MSRSNSIFWTATLLGALGLSGAARGQDPPEPSSRAVGAESRATAQGIWVDRHPGGEEVIVESEVVSEDVVVVDYLVVGHCTIAYGRPEWRAEHLTTSKAGKLKRWRFGRDAWTTFTTDVPLKVGDVPLAAGRYYVVLELGAEENAAALVFLDPLSLSGRNSDASRADQTEGGVVVPVTVELSSEPKTPLTLGFSADAKDLRRLDITIAFGPIRIAVPIVSDRGGFARVEPENSLDGEVIGCGMGSPFVDRRGGRKRLGSRGGLTQAAVGVGLEWLKNHQSVDGSWDCDGFMANGDTKKGPLCDGRGQPQYDVGVTGLALLAFLGAGQTHRDGAYKEPVRKGLKWLAAQQDAEGCFGPRTFHYTYNHGVAALAMAEAWGLTHSGVWKAPAQKGVDFILAARNPYKAWRYDVKPGDNDVSVTSWMAMALHSAKLGGDLIVPEEPMKHAVSFVKEMTDEATGRTGYTRKGERPVRPEGREVAYPAEESESLTALGMFVRILGGEKPKDSAVLKAGAELLSRRLPVWDKSAGKIDMYYWYYGTLAMYQMGGDAWNQWHVKMIDAVVKHQRTDGNFRGSWDPADAWGEDGGRVYSTALMTMCLEVYYRYDRVR